jgi:hypothetical protein
MPLSYPLVFRLAFLCVRFRNSSFLHGGVVSRMPNLPTWRTGVYLFVWHLPQNLSSMGGPTSSYTATGIAFLFIGARKPPHLATRCFRQGGDAIEGAITELNSPILNVPTMMTAAAEEMLHNIHTRQCNKY